MVYHPNKMCLPCLDHNSGDSVSKTFLLELVMFWKWIGGGGHRGINDDDGQIGLGVVNTQYSVDVFWNCAPETCIILLTSVTPINSIKMNWILGANGMADVCVCVCVCVCVWSKLPRKWFESICSQFSQGWYIANAILRCQRGAAHICFKWLQGKEGAWGSDKIRLAKYW